MTKEKEEDTTPEPAAVNAKLVSLRCSSQVLLALPSRSDWFPICLAVHVPEANLTTNVNTAIAAAPPNIQKLSNTTAWKGKRFSWAPLKCFQGSQSLGLGLLGLGLGFYKRYRTRFTPALGIFYFFFQEPLPPLSCKVYTHRNDDVWHTPTLPNLQCKSTQEAQMEFSTQPQDDNIKQGDCCSQCAAGLTLSWILGGLHRHFSEHVSTLACWYVCVHCGPHLQKL